jgi:asparagine synthase (glutamine-hydrolysing)
MCGIAGFYNLLTCDPQVCLTIMGNTMIHRGPDAEGFYKDDTVGLVHRRLSIIDLSATANQPMHSQCGRYVMVYNGEVYNYREIQTEIEKEKGLSFRTHSDSEVVIEAFALWGTDCVKRFNGMFAIAIYDKQDHRLYLMRDRIGIKPLFIFRKGNQLSFASEIKALLIVPEIKSALQQNRNAFTCFLHLGYIPQPQTAWTEIQKFPAGCTACFDGEKLSINSYWSAAERISENVMLDEEDATARLKDLLISSVKMRLVSDVPFGTFLSGGIDSSLVTAISQSVNTGPLNTFSIGFADSAYDESIYARAVAEHLGTKHHEFQMTEKEAMELVTGLNSIYDEPFADSSAIPTLLVSKMAKQHVTMTLSGDGGDELFMGYGAYRWAERLQHPFWKITHRPMAALFKYGNSRQKRIGEMLSYSGQDLRSHIFSQEQYLFSIAEIGGMLTDQQTFPKFQTLEKFYPETSRQLKPSEKQALYDLSHYLKDDLLVKVDRASMQHSLETRVPLLDYRIVEFALNLDPSLKYRNGVTKYLLKKILFQYLPKTLFDRPKKGFAVPLSSWMKGPLKPWVLDNLNIQRILDKGLVKPESVQFLLDKFYSGGSDYLYNRIWALVVLHQ